MYRFKLQKPEDSIGKDPLDMNFTMKTLLNQKPKNKSNDDDLSAIKNWQDFSITHSLITKNSSKRTLPIISGSNKQNLTESGLQLRPKGGSSASGKLGTFHLIEIPGNEDGVFNEKKLLSEEQRFGPSSYLKVYNKFIS